MIKIVIIFFIIIILLYIYDRNINILNNIDIYNIKNILGKIFLFIDNILNINFNYENFNNMGYNIDNDKYKNIIKKIPDVNCLESLFNKLINEINNNKTNLKQFKLSISLRINYYKQKIHNNIYDVLNKPLANNEMINLLDTQSKIKNIIHDFIFITPYSNLPIELQNLLDEFNNCFLKINKQINIYNNKKFYNNNEYHKINNNSSFIFNNGNDPVPSNTFYDNLNYF
jgi:hypothetical protein